ncbi:MULTISPECIES: efflux RND transporter permease subunit [Marinobacter]|uniref:efflux RND transporter permease subunit n=1 Tax=Marinobacter TaxID=2742 RepID=UPI000C3C1216|nr:MULTISPECIES: MMPL family transporter [Marinobacter]MAO12133.1 RND transporter [Marinobacter sp.]|tara:strand:+ start:840 stop:3236 length:2397 start_codon:yes stop_codon:yes gene_type:complete
MSANKQQVDNIRSLEDFDTRSGSVVERALFNNRAIVVILCLLATAFLGLQARDITMSAAFQKMIPTNHPFIINYQEHRSELAGSENSIRIAVETTQGSIFDREYLETLRQLSEELFLLPGVDRPFMKHLWAPAVRWSGVTEVGLDGGPVIPDDYDGSSQSLEQIRENVERSGEIGQLVAEDYRSTIIFVPLQELNNVTGETIDYHDLGLRLESLRAKYESDDINIYITGFAKVVGDLINGMQEVLLFLALTIAICAVVLFFYTRCLRSTLLVVLCSMVAVVWLLGLLRVLGFELDPYSILVPFLVFAIGMSHGAQKMNGIMQDIGRGTHKFVAARHTFRRLFIAGLTALVSDAIGFAVLMVIDIPVIQDLAVTASIGVAALIFTNLILLPILLSYTGVNGKAATRSVLADIDNQNDITHSKHPVWALLDKFTERKVAGVTILVFGTLGVMGIVVGSNVKIGDTDIGAPELRSDSRYNLDNQFMVTNYAASSDVYVVMVKTEQYACIHYETMKGVDALERRLQQLPGVESTQSLAGLTKVANVGMNEGSLKWWGIPETQGMLNAIVTRAPRELFNQNCDLLTVFAFLKDHKADTLSSVVAATEAFSAEYSTDSLRFINAAGNAGIEAATNIVVEQANLLMLVLVYAAVIVLAFVTFRSWRAVVCAVLPLMITSALCQALMVWLDIGIKVATLPVIALGVGIGVDYALYILSVTLARLRAGENLSDAYYGALLFTGKVVILTGITLGVAVLTWWFSPIKFQADMGLLLAFMFIWNMVGALVLLPALARFLLVPKMQPVTS